MGRKILQNPNSLSKRIVYFKALLTTISVVLKYCILF